MDCFIFGSIINLFVMEEKYRASETFFVACAAGNLGIKMYHYLINQYKFDKMLQDLEELIKFSFDERFNKNRILMNQFQ